MKDEKYLYPNRINWTVQLLREKGQGHDNYWFGRWQFLFLWSHIFKAIICVWLGRRKPHDYKIDTVNGLAHLNFHKYTDWEFGQNATWDELAVGFGWTNWFYETYDNSWL